MITFYDKYTQMVVSQTIHAEFVQKLHDEEPRDGWIKDPDGVRTLTNLILGKMMLTHRTYELIASPRDVNEQGITNEICWRAGNLDLPNPLPSWQDRFEDRPISFDMNGGFINHGSPDKPSWGSHS
tara:strand:+ start:44 stop:421 length:378 start_codon:yes stop_codon:yes gene_type:complete